MLPLTTIVHQIRIMVFIREENYYYGFLMVDGRKYTFDLTIRDSTQKDQRSLGSLNVEWRLLRDLGAPVNSFLKKNNHFRDPQDFYDQFSDFVKNNLKVPTKTKKWLQHPLKISVLAKSLENEIDNVSNYIKQFNFETQLAKIEVSDSQLRVHKAVIKLSLNYKNEAIKVISHDLPQQKVGELSNLDFENIFSVTEFCKKFTELINCFQQFWNMIALLDSQCCVLDPINPTYKDVFRRIKLSETVSVVLTFNPYCISQRPKIKLLGRQSDVDHFQVLLQNNLEKDLWDNEADLLYNLSNILEVTIPIKMFEEEINSLDLMEAGECAICFTRILDDKIPSEMCENVNCKLVYHLKCLFTYLNSVPRNRNYFGKIQGECPNCSDVISCTVPKLM